MSTGRERAILRRTVEELRSACTAPIPSWTPGEDPIMAYRNRVQETVERRRQWVDDLIDRCKAEASRGIAYPPVGGAFIRRAVREAHAALDDVRTRQHRRLDQAQHLLLNDSTPEPRRENRRPRPWWRRWF